MNDWKKLCVGPEATLGEAVRQIDRWAQQVAMVVDGEDRLLGIVTDGDARRALLRGLGMDAPVTEVMGKTPRTAKVGASREAQIGEMQRASIRHLPIVDEANRVIALSTLAEQLTPPRRENRVVLMAGGLGTRLAPLTDDCPKSMLEVGKKPLLETILENFVAEGFHRFTFSVNYLANMVEEHFGDGSRWGVEIEYMREAKRMGTAGALSLLPQRPTEPLIVMNGDLLTKASFGQMLEFHDHYSAAGTMAVRQYEFQVPYGVVATEEHRISRIEEKPVHSFFVNAGMYVLSPEALDHVPADTFYDMPTLFSRLIEQGAETAVFPIREYWLDIGHMSDYQRANGEYFELFT